MFCDDDLTEESCARRYENNLVHESRADPLGGSRRGKRSRRYGDRTLSIGTLWQSRLGIRPPCRTGCTMRNADELLRAPRARIKAKDPRVAGFTGGRLWRRRRLDRPACTHPSDSAQARRRRKFPLRIAGLLATVPDRKVPFITILQGGQPAFGVFDDLLRKYHWCATAAVSAAMHCLPPSSRRWSNPRWRRRNSGGSGSGTAVSEGLNSVQVENDNQLNRPHTIFSIHSSVACAESRDYRSGPFALLS